MSTETRQGAAAATDVLRNNEQVVTEAARNKQGNEDSQRRQTDNNSNREGNRDRNQTQNPEQRTENRSDNRGSNNNSGSNNSASKPPMPTAAAMPAPVNSAGRDRDGNQYGPSAPQYQPSQVHAQVNYAGGVADVQTTKTKWSDIFRFIANLKAENVELGWAMAWGVTFVISCLFWGLCLWSFILSAAEWGWVKNVNPKTGWIGYFVKEPGMFILMGIFYILITRVEMEFWIRSFFRRLEKNKTNPVGQPKTQLIIPLIGWFIISGLDFGGVHTLVSDLVTDSKVTIWVHLSFPSGQWYTDVAGVVISFIFVWGAEPALLFTGRKTLEACGLVQAPVSYGGGASYHPASNMGRR